jgi:hypothetical protein
LHPGRAPFTTILIDAGYTCKKIMQYVVRKDKIFYGVPLREYQKQLWRNPAYRFCIGDFA